MRTSNIVVEMQQWKQKRIHRTAPIFWGKHVKDETYMDERVTLIAITDNGMYVKLHENPGTRPEFKMLDARFLDGNWELAEDWPDDYKPRNYRPNIAYAV